MEAEAEAEAGMEAYDRSNYCSSHYFCDFDINLCSIKKIYFWSPWVCSVSMATSLLRST